MPRKIYPTIPPHATLHAAALLYARAGIPIFPLRPLGKKPLYPGVFAEQATTDPKRITEIWTKHPKANIGIPTGEISGLYVFDLDKRSDKDGFATYAVQQKKLGSIDTNMRCRTCGEGLHLYCDYVQGLGNTEGLFGEDSGMDTRGEGGYVVAPPSRTEKGLYRWEKFQHPAPIPDKWLKLLQGEDIQEGPTPKTRITRKQRYNKANPCPVCEGYEKMPTGKGIRCWGFLSDDDDWGLCTREDFSEGLKASRNGYWHLLVGTCGCGQQHAPDRPGRRLILKPFSAYAEKKVDWLWNPLIPQGKLTIVDGLPGSGKTWLLLQIAAAVTTGGPLPCMHSVSVNGKLDFENVGIQGSVIFYSNEDDVDDCLRPRFSLAGGDIDKIFASEGITGPKKTEALTLKDLRLIEETIRQRTARLVVFDTLAGYLGSGTDMNKANEVQPVLAGLKDIARRTACAIVTIRHTRKSSGDGLAIQAGIGSTAIGGVARSVLLVGGDPILPDRRIVAPVKMSYSHMPPSLAFEIKKEGILWIGQCNTKANDMVELRKRKGPQATTREDAQEFLQDVLSDGPSSSAAIRKEAKELGISWSSIRRAVGDLKIESFQSQGQWWSKLPSKQMKAF